MKTIERNISGVIVNQRGRDNYFLLSDILAVVTKCNEGKKKRDKFSFKKYKKSKSTKRFFKYLRKELNIKKPFKPEKKSKWVSPLVALDILSSACPKFRADILTYANSF